MAHHIAGAPLVKKIKFFFVKTTNGAPWEWCAITSSTSNGAPPPRGAICRFEENFKKIFLLMAHRGCGAPLVFGH